MYVQQPFPAYVLVRLISTYFSFLISYSEIANTVIALDTKEINPCHAEWIKMTRPFPILANQITWYSLLI